jgi:D-xylose transport system substrate-binding protein
MTTGCKPKVPKIGILIHSYENERWIKDKNYMVENLTRLGAEVMVEEAGGDQNKQFTQAQEMVKKGAKVLIVAAANSDQASRIVDMAHESKVKVIAYDRLINGCKLDYYISANSTQIGELMTSYVTSLKPEGKYALIPGSKYDNNAQRIFLGQMNVLQPYMESGDIQVVYSEFTEAWTAAEGELHTKRILEQNPDITAIIAGSDAITNGVLKVLKENGLESKVFVTGQDAEIVNVKNVMNGTQTCDILKPLKEMAQVTAELAMDIAQEKPITIKFITESNGKSLVKSVLLEAIVVNKNNVQSTVISSGFHTAAELN